MKRKTAKDLLADSFRELAEKKSVDKITVREIAEGCGYSPATFYRQFRDKYDLIAWDYSRSISEIMDRIGQGYPWPQTLLDAANFFQEQRDYLANLFLHTSGHDSFVRYMEEINYQSLRGSILRVMGREELDEGMSMLVRVYCLGTVNLTCEWILGAYHATAQELAKVYEHALPEPLQPYLHET